MLFHIGSTNVNSTNVPLAQALHVAYTFMCMPHAFMPSAQACIHAIGTSMHSCHRHKHAFMPSAQACIHAIGTSLHSCHWHKHAFTPLAQASAIHISVYATCIFPQGTPKKIGPPAASPPTSLSPYPGLSGSMLIKEALEACLGRRCPRGHPQRLQLTQLT
jgi:hypothetical protein